MKDNTYGKLFHLIRTSKKLSLKNIADENVSVSTISQFENGKTLITIDKFFKLLNIMNVSAEEFHELYDYYYLKDSSLNNFSIVVNEEYYSKDIRSLEYRIERLKKQLLNSEIERKNNYLLQIVLEGYIYRLDNTKKVSERKINYLYDYLKNIEIWGLFEFYLMSSCSHIFSERCMESLGNKILPALSLYSNSTMVYTVGLTMLHNMILSCLKQGWMILAGTFLKYSENAKLTGRPLFLKASFTYDKGWYSVITGNVDSGLETMNNIYEFYMLIGEKKIAGFMSDEINQLVKEYKI